MKSRAAALTVAKSSALTEVAASPRMARSITGPMICSQPSRSVDSVPSKSKTTWAGRCVAHGLDITSISEPG